MGWWLRKLALVEDPGSVPTLGSSQLMPVPGISHTLFAFPESLYTSKARKLTWAHTHINLNVKGHRLKAELTVLSSGVNTGLEFSSQCPKIRQRDLCCFLLSVSRTPMQQKALEGIRQLKLRI